MARYDNLITGRAAGIEKLLREQKEKPAPPPPSDALIVAQAADLGSIQPQAKGRPRRHYKGMTKLERDYWDMLNLRLRAGELLWIAYEPWSLRLGGGAHYTPDFVMMLPDGRLECHETKGYWEEASRVRIKVAAEMYWMFSFVAVTRKDREWQYEPIGRA